VGAQFGSRFLTCLQKLISTLSKNIYIAMKLSGFNCNPNFAPHSSYAHPNFSAIPSCCNRSKIIRCSQNEPSGRGRSLEHTDSSSEFRLNNKNIAAWLLSFMWSTSPAAASAATAATELAASAASVVTTPYTPSPMEPGWEIYVGFVAGVVPFIIASYEFGKRIIIQRRCPECLGKGLVQRGKVLRKCTQCGGMLPWLGWKMFLFSTIKDPGNGGPLNQPKGQKSIFYSVPKRQEDSTLASSEEKKES
jgi:hypothetical protein